MDKELKNKKIRFNLIEKIQEFSAFLLKENELANRVIEKNRSPNYLKYSKYKINLWFMVSIVTFTLIRSLFEYTFIPLGILCIVITFLSVIYNTREFIFYIKNYKKFVVRNSPLHHVATVMAGCKSAAPLVKTCAACLGSTAILNDLYYSATGVNPIREYSQVYRGNQSLQDANEHISSGARGHGHPLRNKLDLANIKNEELNECVKRQQKVIENLSKNVIK